MSDQGLYINSFYFIAFNKWNTISAPYLDRAELIERSFIEAAKPSYLYEQALIKKDSKLFDEAIRTLDPVWEKQYQSKALAERILISKKSETNLKREYLESLFTINPAAFIEYDLKLPVTFKIQDNGNKASTRDADKLSRLLLHAGFSSDLESPYYIDIFFSEETLKLSLVNSHNNHTIYTQDKISSSGFAQDIHNFVNTFSTKVFRTDLGI